MNIYIALFLVLVLQVWIVQKEGFSREGTFIAADFVSNELPQCRSACIQQSSVPPYNA